jgi:hypothetical protein
LRTLTAGVDHHCELVGVELAAAEPIEQDMDLHACPRALREGLGEFPAYRPRPVDVALESDRLPRPANGGKHRREDLVAVQQHFEPIPLEDRGTEQHPHRAGKLGIGSVVQASGRPIDLLFACLEVEGDEARGGRETDRNCRDICAPDLRTTSTAKHVPAMVSRTGATVCSSSHRRVAAHLQRSAHRQPEPGTQS